jgi:serine/threonine-protein kinase
MAVTAGSRLGAYEVLAPIGQGGMGEVWRARDTRLGREVALKTLPEAFASDPDRLARFEREARLLASLNHPNVGIIHGFEEAGETRFLVLELVESPTLAELIARRAADPSGQSSRVTAPGDRSEARQAVGVGPHGTLSVEDALTLALQIAEALEAAHEKGVIHRDLKPANIKVTPEGKVKVLDFGLAKAFEGERASDPNLTHSPTLSLAATQQGIILGTAAYMSPEQAKGQLTDRRTDVWAFGCVLYEMLAGRPAFGGEDVTTILARVVDREPDFATLPPRLHPKLFDLLGRCLQKDARRRYHDIADVRLDLEGILADPAGVFAPAAATTGTAATGRTGRSMPAIGIAAVLAAVAAGTAAWYLKPAEPTQVVRFHSELPGTSTFRFLNYPVVAMSPDGRLAGYNTSAGIYLLSVDQPEGRLVPGTEGALANVMISTDGGWIGYADLARGQLVKVPVGGGGSVSVTTVQGNIFNGASWTDDGWILFAEGRTVKRVPENGGTPEVLFEVTTGQALLPRMLPDGNTLLFSQLTGTEMQTVVWSLGAEEPDVSFPGGWAQYMPSGYLVYGVDESLFARRFDLSARALAGGPISVVEDVSAGFGPQFDISASGSLVYIPAGSSGTGDRTLAVVAPDGREQVLEGIPPGAYSSPRVSPDGTRVVVQTTEDAPLTTNAARVWIYDLSGDTALRPLTQSGKNFHPIWTPDSQRVTFASDRDGPVSIYWQAADGSGVPERLTTAGDGTEHWPDLWSPDGRTLAYQVVSGADYDIWTLSLDSPDAPRPFAVGPARQHGAAFSPDGRWLALGTGTGVFASVYKEGVL